MDMLDRWHNRVVQQGFIRLKPDRKTVGRPLALAWSPGIQTMHGMPYITGQLSDTPVPAHPCKADLSHIAPCLLDLTRSTFHMSTESAPVPI